MRANAARAFPYQARFTIGYMLRRAPASTCRRDAARRACGFGRPGHGWVWPGETRPATVAPGYRHAPDRAMGAAKQTTCHPRPTVNALQVQALAPRPAVRLPDSGVERPDTRGWAGRCGGRVAADPGRRENPSPTCTWARRAGGKPDRTKAGTQLALYVCTGSARLGCGCLQALPRLCEPRRARRMSRRRRSQREGIMTGPMYPALAGRAAVAGFGAAIALFAVIGAAQARFYLWVRNRAAGPGGGAPCGVCPCAGAVRPAAVASTPGLLLRRPGRAGAGRLCLGARRLGLERRSLCLGPRPLCAAAVARCCLGGGRVVPRPLRLGLAGPPLALTPASRAHPLRDVAPSHRAPAHGTRAHASFQQMRPQPCHADQNEINRDDQVQQPRDERMRIPATSATTGCKVTASICIWRLSAVCRVYSLFYPPRRNRSPSPGPDSRFIDLLPVAHCSMWPIIHGQCRRDPGAGPRSLICGRFARSHVCDPQNSAGRVMPAAAYALAAPAALRMAARTRW